MLWFSSGWAAAALSHVVSYSEFTHHLAILRCMTSETENVVKQADNEYATCAGIQGRSRNVLAATLFYTRHSGRFCAGDRFSGDWSPSDRLYTAGNEGFHTVDGLRKVTRRQSCCRLSCLVARRQRGLTGDSTTTQFVCELSNRRLEAKSSTRNSLFV